MKIFIQWFLFNSSYNWIETPRSQVPILNFPLMTLLKLFVLLSCSLKLFVLLSCSFDYYYYYYYHYHYHYHSDSYYSYSYYYYYYYDDDDDGDHYYYYYYYHFLSSTSVYVMNTFSLLLTIEFQFDEFPFFHELSKLAAWNLKKVIRRTKKTIQCALN